MKKVLSIVFLLSIVAVFAAVNQNSLKDGGKHPKKVVQVKDSPCSDELQKRIAACYGIDPIYVCCITVGGGYYISGPTITYNGSLNPVSCGSGCTTFCVVPYGTGTQCCFDLPYDWPSGC